MFNVIHMTWRKRRRTTHRHLCPGAASKLVFRPYTSVMPFFCSRTLFHLDAQRCFNNRGTCILAARQAEPESCESLLRATWAGFLLWTGPCGLCHVLGAAEPLLLLVRDGWDVPRTGTERREGQGRQDQSGSFGSLSSFKVGSQHT